MNDYRKKMSEHFQSKPLFSLFLHFDAIIILAGLLLLIAGKICLLIPKAISLYYIFPAFGFPLFLFGLVLAFIKEDDLILFGALALFAVFRLICLIVILFKYSLALAYTPLIELLIAVCLLFTAVKLPKFSKTRSSAAPAQKNVREEKRSADEEQVFEAEDTLDIFDSLSDEYCHVCGASVNPSSAFCEICGTPITPPETPCCPDCGTPSQPGCDFCTVCGRSLS